MGYLVKQFFSETIFSKTIFVRLRTKWLWVRVQLQSSTFSLNFTKKRKFSYLYFIYTTPPIKVFVKSFEKIIGFRGFELFTV